MNGTRGNGILNREGRKVPLYLQIAQLIRQRVFLGEIESTLPAEGELAGEFGVSGSVIRNALAKLREEGLIVTQHGVGSKVAAKPELLRVEASPGDTVLSRMPTPAERARLRIAEGVPVMAVRHPDGREDLYDSLRTRVICP